MISFPFWLLIPKGGDSESSPPLGFSSSSDVARHIAGNSARRWDVRFVDNASKVAAFVELHGEGYEFVRFDALLDETGGRDISLADLLAEAQSRPDE